MKIIEILKNYVTNAVVDAKSILMGKGKGSSKLIKALKIKVKAAQYTVSVELPLYGKYVSEGRKPGKQPPLNVIEKWCQRKGIDKKAAFPIAKKIGKEGLEPTNFLDPIYEIKKILPQLSKEFNFYIKESLKEVKTTKISI